MKTVLATLAAAFLWFSAGLAQAPDGAAVYQTHCAICHDEAASHAPGRNVFRQSFPELVINSMADGTMKDNAAALSADERRAVALFLTGKAFGNLPELAAPGAYCSDRTGDFSDPLKAPSWNGWSPSLDNKRFQETPGFKAEDVPKLKLKWAFGIPRATIANGQPTVVNGRLYVGTASPAVFSLDANTGCIKWVYQPSAGVRAAITIGKPSGLSQFAAFFGDGRAYVYAVNASDGKLIWKTSVEAFSSARITGAPRLYGDRLYVPVSIVEEGLATNPKYECCRSRGSVVALDASTGKQIWRYYTIDEVSTPRAKNAIGTQLWGPAGASVWSAVTLDPEKKVMYFATGNNHSSPPTPGSDAIHAVDMETGKRLWVKQVTPNDAYNVACVRPDSTNCPEENGPDVDFGSAPILASLPNGKRVLIAGQKSGVVTALDPDAQGNIVWQQRIGKGGTLGGILWGSTADKDNAYVPLSDVARIGDPKVTIERVLDPTKGGGLFALRLTDGAKVWTAPPADCQGRKNCSPAQSAAISSIPGAVFSGAQDGHIRGYSTKDGKVIWDFDTVREFETVNKTPAHGGTIDGPGPAIAGGMMFVPSGNGSWSGLPGNVLLAFSVDGK